MVERSWNNVLKKMDIKYGLAFSAQTKYRLVIIFKVMFIIFKVIFIEMIVLLELTCPLVGPLRPMSPGTTMLRVQKALKPEFPDKVI